MIKKEWYWQESYLQELKVVKENKLLKSAASLQRETTLFKK